MSHAAPRGGRCLTLALACAAVLASAAPALASADPPPMVGLNAHSVTQQDGGSSSAEDVDREFALMSAAGADVARINVSWSAIEHDADDVYSERSLGHFGVVLDAAERHGVKLLVILKSTPCWASTALRIGRTCIGYRRMAAPASAGAFADFARFLVDWAIARGRLGTLAGLEVWNEPNGSYFVDPAKYKALVEETNERVAEIPIVAGGLKPKGGLQYMQLAYAAGIAGEFDVWSLHAYGPDPDGVLGLVEAFRAKQLELGDSPPIWVDEFGWTTCTAPLGLRLGDCGVSSPVATGQQQAEWLTETFSRLGDLDYVDGAISYELRNAGIESGLREDNFGIVRRDFSEKPAYDAITACLTASSC